MESARKLRASAAFPIESNQQFMSFVQHFGAKDSQVLNSSLEMEDFHSKFSKIVRSAPYAMERIPGSNVRYDVYLIFPLDNWLVFMKNWLKFMNSCLVFMNDGSVFMNDGLVFMNVWSEFMNDGLGFMNGWLGFMNDGLVFMNGWLGFMKNRLESMNNFAFPLRNWSAPPDNFAFRLDSPDILKSKRPSFAANGTLHVRSIGKITAHGVLGNGSLVRQNLGRKN